MASNYDLSCTECDVPLEDSDIASPVMECAVCDHAYIICSQCRELTEFRGPSTADKKRHQNVHLMSGEWSMTCSNCPRVTTEESLADLGVDPHDLNYFVNESEIQNLDDDTFVKSIDSREEMCSCKKDLQVVPAGASVGGIGANAGTLLVWCPEHTIAYEIPQEHLGWIGKRIL